MPENVGMAITSSSTLAEIKAEYLGNVGYTTVAGATAFVSACRALLVSLPSLSMSGSKRADFNVALIERQLKSAEQYVAQNSGGGRARYWDLSEARE